MMLIRVPSSWSESHRHTFLEICTILIKKVSQVTIHTCMEKYDQKYTAMGIFFDYTNSVTLLVYVSFAVKKYKINDFEQNKCITV